MVEDLYRRVQACVSCAIDRARALKTRLLASVSGPIAPPEDLLAIMQQAAPPDGRCFLWERPLDRFAIAGLGAAHTCSGQGASRFTDVAAACDAILTHAVTDWDSGRPTAPLFVGGFAFAGDSMEETPWLGFPAGRLVLPRLLLMRRDREATLTVSVMVDAHSDRAELTRRVSADLQLVQHPAVPPDSAWHSEPTPPSYQATTMLPLPLWRQAVTDSISDIARGRVEKLVLARVCTVTSSRAFDCARVLRRLRRSYPACVVFWIGTPAGSFVGATPEPLIRRSGQTLATAAIAGTGAPGTSTATAQALGQALLHSEKERTEHAIVVRAITAILAPLCTHLDVATRPQLLRLDNVQHLMTPITGRLARPIHILDLVDRLHPSPAVAGHPRSAALQLLRERESLHRGWYAGPVGWINARGEGEFAVAIRSALLHGSRASVYAGAGIVAGSDPDAELEETRLKLQPLLSALLAPTGE
ncbi:MAG: isochorismate synthase MenF [Candidatus Binatia bacterium]